MNKLERAHKFAVDECKLPYTYNIEAAAQVLWDLTDGESDIDEYIAAILYPIVAQDSTKLQKIGRHFNIDVVNILTEIIEHNRNNISEGSLNILLSNIFSNSVSMEDRKIPNKTVKQHITNTINELDSLECEMTNAQMRLLCRIKVMLALLKSDRSL